MIEFKCKHCDSLYKVKDDYAGKQVRCKKCGHVTVIEAIEADNNLMPDFDALFTALAEEERRQPTLEDSMLGV